MHELAEKFVTKPETGDNRYIFQPVFHNRNLMYCKNTGKRENMVTSQQVDFKIQDNITITVNELFSHGTFISYDDFHEKITPINENGYLLLKHHLMTIFRPSGKYGPPIKNKNVQDWNIESMSELFNSKAKGQKN